MNSKELAALLNGREIRKEITLVESALAKDSGLVVVYGSSDDLMEFDGAINDEIGCFEGGTAYLTSAGLLANDCNEDDCPYFEQLREKAVPIYAGWCEEDSLSWIYSTSIPHETFTIFEDGVAYCRGIVFALSDVKEQP